MTMNVIINGKKYPVEVKLTQKAKSMGMMNRNHLDGGMLFMFNYPSNQSFWMKNCLIPLDIIFIDDGKINKIHRHCKPCDSDECERYEGYGDMVLEFVGGFCEENDINEGDEINFS
jgi:uncharacterized membrane protein (UPF0127 family)